MQYHSLVVSVVGVVVAAASDGVLAKVVEAIAAFPELIKITLDVPCSQVQLHVGTFLSNFQVIHNSGILSLAMHLVMLAERMCKHIVLCFHFLSCLEHNMLYSSGVALTSFVFINQSPADSALQDLEMVC